LPKSAQNNLGPKNCESYPQTKSKLSKDNQDTEIERGKFLLDLYQKALLLSEKELDDYFLDHAVSLTGSTIGFFHFVSDDQKSIMLTAWNGEALKNCVANYDTHYSIELAGNWVDCVRLKRPVIYNDFAKSPNQKGFPSGHVLIKRFMSIPIFEKEKVKIVFGVGNKNNPYTKDDVVQLQLIANELSKIYQKRQSENALRESEKKYRSLFENMLDGFAYCRMIFDEKDNPVDFEYLEINEAFERLTGLKREAVIGKKVTEAIPGTEKANPELFEIYGRVAVTCKEEKFEIYFKPLSRWFSISVYCPMKGYFAAVFEDITQSKQAGEALRKLNRHLRAISNSNQALMHADDEAEFTQQVCNIIINDCGYALVWVGFAEHDKEKNVRPVAFAGFDKEYIDALRITWNDESERGKGPTGTVIRTGKPCVCKNMQIDPNFKPWRSEANKRGYTASLVLPLISFEGETFGALNIYSKESNPFTDEEVKLLTELANDFAYGIMMLRLSKEKEQSAETLRKQAELIDISPVAIIVRKVDGTITFWSKGAEKLYGWTKNKAIGQDINRLLKTESSQPIEEIVKKLTLDHKWSGEIVHSCKNGSKLVVQSYWLGRFGAEGKIEEILESNVDITDRIQMQIKLEESAVRLEEYANQMEELANQRAEQLKDAERLATIGATAGMVGHDIRNPLQAITGDLYLAKTELTSIPESEEKKNIMESLTEIEKNIDYINKIVADLQDFARPLNPHAEETDIKIIIDDLLKKNSLPENVRVNVNVETDARKVVADSTFINRIMYNLVNNAIQAMPKGGKLTIHTYKEANDTVLTVKDTGIGIPEAVKGKLFTPMFTTKSKGQGFGLAVIKRMTESLGGAVSFESQEGKGTTFTIRLPQKAE
jgi:PAS domain S-box-containing protein